jgi:hypothetical protein
MAADILYCIKISKTPLKLELKFAILGSLMLVVDKLLSKAQTIQNFPNLQALNSLSKCNVRYQREIDTKQ